MFRAPLTTPEDHLNRLGDTTGQPQTVLTRHERDVLQLLAEGASNKAIARTLGVSSHTAKFHIASLLRKLGALRPVGGGRHRSGGPAC